MSNRLGRALRGLSLVCLWLIAAVSAAPALAQTQVVQEGFAPQIHNGVTALAAGWHHSCALHSDGSVFCWGNNDAGQSTPPPATRFIAISAGWFDTCGVRDDHTLTCWGQKPELREVPNGDFDSVAVNDQSQACALNSQGYVRCWGPGYNVWGAQPQSNYVALSAAGDQTCGLSAKYYVIECWRAETVAQPLTVPGGPYRALSVGMDQVCGLQESGEVRCWDTGNNSEREGRAGPFIALTAGGSGVCALNQYGHAECWGSGQLLAPVPADSFTTLIAGHDHACAIRPDGAVSCWGGNYFGEAIPPPVMSNIQATGEGVAPNGQGQVRALASGDFHTCALRSDGMVSCWGNNNFGQSSSPSPYLPPGPQPESALKFTAIGAGGSSTCGIREDGNVMCWGEYIGQPPLNGPFVSVAVGIQHACALRADGSAACWGGGGWQPMGRYLLLSADGNRTCGLRFDGSMECWFPWGDSQLMPNGPYKALSLSSSQRCGVTQTGDIRCWDMYGNYERQWIPGPFTAVSASGQVVCGLRPNSTAECMGDTWDWSQWPPQGAFTALSAGLVHVCGIRPDGTVSCWGRNEFGQITPPKVLTLPPSIASGGQHSCAVRLDGRIDCWGDNSYGQSTPPDGSFLSVGTGERNSCGLKEDGSVVCWGDNADGQSTPPPEAPFAQMSVGRMHGCGVTPGGQALCWGWNSNGQATPPDAFYDGFADVSAGLAHSCGVSRDYGNGICWGYNGEGQTNVPQYGLRWRTIQAGDQHSCGLISDGSILCWGSDRDRQLEVPSPGPFTALSVGAFHNCAIRTDGTLVCWGANWAGQSDAPEGTFVAVSAGDNHTCAVRGDGTRQCWGTNAFGQAPRRTLFPDQLWAMSLNQPVSFRFILVEGDSSSPYYYGQPVPAQFKVTAGALPSGLSLGMDGELSGAPTQAGKYTFTVTSVDEHGFGSAREYQVVVDGTPPVIEPRFAWPADENGWFASNVILQWDITDPESQPWQVSGCELIDLRTDTAGTTYTCTAQSVGGTTTKSVTVKRDLTAPETTWTATPATATNNARAVFEFTGTDATAGVNRLECALDSEIFFACSSPFTVYGGDGQHTLRVRAVDNAGNIDATPAMYQWKVDTTPPVITFTVDGHVGTNGWYSSIASVNINWTVSDPDSTVTSTGCNPVQLSTDTPGASFTCTATSIGGTVSKTVTLKRDGTEPSTNFIEPFQRSGNSTTATFWFAGWDATSGVDHFMCKLDDGNYAPCASGVSYTVAPGAHKFRVFAVDAAGNADTFIQEATWSADVTPPLLTPMLSGSLGSGGWYVGDVQFYWSKDDPDFGILTQTGCEPHTIATDTSGSEFVCTVTSYGGATTKSVTIKRDTVPPDTAISGAPAAYSRTATAQFSLEGTDATAGVAAFECSLDGAAFASCESTVSYAALSDGTHTFAARAVDNAGHRDPAPATHTWEIETDDTPPTIVPSVTGELGSEGWYVGNVQIGWDVSDDGSAVTSGNGCSPFTLTTDTPSAGFTCNAESAGGSASRTVTVQRDATAPQIVAAATTEANVAGWYNDDVTVAFACSDATSGIVACAGAQRLEGEGVLASSAATITDRAGNRATSNQVTAKIDRTAPTLAPAVSPGTVLLNGTASAAANGGDGLSGIAGESCAVLATGSIGTKTVSCTVTDRAGNSASASAGYRMVYGFVGFSSPVQNPSTLNVIKAGRSVPLRWRVIDAQGAPVTDLASATVTATAISCPSATENRIYTYGGSSGQLQNLGNGYYQLDWMVPTSLRGYCRRLDLNLGDGQSHPAQFKFN